MPDRDVFNRHVIRGFQSASRRMLGSADDPNALKSVIWALARKLRDNGCPGLNDIVDVIANALTFDDQDAARVRAQARLERIRLEYGSGTTETTIQAARRVLSAPETLGSSEGVQLTEDELRIKVAVSILADLADAWMCPAPMLPELIEEGIVSFQALRARRERAKALVAASPHAWQLAKQLLADPSGGSVKAPRMRRVKMSQAEILVTALTD